MINSFIIKFDIPNPPPCCHPATVSSPQVDTKKRFGIADIKKHSA